MKTANRASQKRAIYHVMARGNARQKIVRDDADRRRLIDGLEQSVVRHGWELLSYVVMGNHLHLMVKTPRPNLGAGMQNFLSGYAIWAGRRWRRLGHLFQGRYRAEMIEDESYYWTVSRYIHLNPVRAGLVKLPEQWEWSRYRGYRDARRRASMGRTRSIAGRTAGRSRRSRCTTGVRPVRGARHGRSAHIAVSRCLWRVGSGLRAILGSTAKSRQFDTVRSTGRRGTTALRARPETDLRSRFVFLRAGRRGTVAASRPPCGAGGRGVALPPAHRGVTARARRGVGTFASRQRP